jgi:exonuclease VII small subunit
MSSVLSRFWRDPTGGTKRSHDDATLPPLEDVTSSDEEETKDADTIFEHLEDPDTEDELDDVRMELDEAVEEVEAAEEKLQEIQSKVVELTTET